MKMKNDLKLATDIKLLKFLIVSDIKYDLLQTKAWREFSEGLNYRVPSQEYLLEEIQPKAHDEYFEEISSSEYNFTITVHCISTGETESKYFLLALATTTAGVLTYIYDTVLDSDNIDRSAPSKTAFLNFCDDAVIKANDLCNVKVRFLINNCCIDLSEEDKYSEDLEYYRYNCLSSLLKELDSIQTSHEYSENFSTEYSQFRINLKNENSLGSATQFLLKSLGSVLFTDDYNSSEKILSYIGPLHMATNYYNPTFKAKIINEKHLEEVSQHLRDQIHFFNDKALPPQCNSEFSMYFNEKDQFTYLFRMYKQNAVEFWKKAEQTCSELPKFAFQLLNIPPFLKDFDCDQIFNCIRKVNDLELERDDASYGFIFCLFLREC